jgi:anti-sigma regulatory factor (Ser/Thr protein kinase)/GAF domain-containing protein
LAPPRQRFAVAPEPYRLARLRARLRDYLERYCTDGNAIWNVVLCVEEACTNAVRHSGSPAEIEVFVGFGGDGLQVVVKDRGHGFDTGRFDPEALPDPEAEHGRGLYLMAHLADEMALRSDGGLEVRLLKRAMLGAAPAEELEAEARGELAEGEEPEAEAGGAPAAAATEQRETETRRDELAAVEERFRVLFESVTEGVALYEPVVREGGAADYRILQANRSFLRQTGLRANGARGRLASEVFGPEPPPRLEEYAEVAGGAAPEVFERVAPATGRSLRLTALPLGAGRFATVSEDVTARKRAVEELDRAATALEGAAAERRRLLDTIRSQADTVRSRAETIRSQAETIRAREAELSAQVTALEAQKRDHAELRAQIAVLEGLQKRAAPQGNGGEPAGPPPTREELSQAQELAERVELAEALNAINRLLHSTLDFDEIMQRALDGGVAALAADAGTIELRDRPDWVVRYQCGFSPEAVGTRLSRGEAPNASRAMAYREPFATADMQAAATDVGFVSEHDLRGVLAVPLFAQDAVIGCLLFYSKRVRVFSDSEIDFGRKLGATVSLAIENSRLLAEQRSAATTLQQHLIHPLPQVAGLELAAVSQPASEPALVGGDFHDVIALKDDLVLVLIGDVTGKGIPAAGMTETVRSAFRTLALISTAPEFILRHINRMMLEEPHTDQLVTALLLRIDLGRGVVSLSSAGHPPPVRVTAAGASLVEPPYRPPLGAFGSTYETRQVPLAAGETLVLYTDGVTEARRAGELLGEQRLLRLLEEAGTTEPQALVDHLARAVADYAGVLQDDVQILALRRTE